VTLATADIAPDTKAVPGSLPLWIGVAIYVLLIAAGNRLLLDPDTQWQITVGQWILDHHAVPHTDIYSFTMGGAPWISTQWLAQVLYAKVYAWFGWTGPVVLAAAASSATFALLARYLVRGLSESAALAFVVVALVLTAPHLLARPHVLALPIMVAWIGELIAAADRRTAPSFWLLPLMALWANVHGGFVFGVVMIAPIALDAVINVNASDRMKLAVRWAVFAALALGAGCCTPYGWESLLAARKILALGRFHHVASVRNLPARGHRARALSRYHLAADAHRDPARARPHGAGAGTRRGNPGAAVAAGSRHPACSSDRRRGNLPAFAEGRPRRGDRLLCGIARGGHVDLCRGASFCAEHRQFAGPGRDGTQEAQPRARLQRLRLRRLSDRERRRALHRRPHRALWREILCRSSQRVRIDRARRSVPPARRVSDPGDADAHAKSRDEAARSHGRLGKNLQRRGRHDPSSQSGCAANCESQRPLSVVRAVSQHPLSTNYGKLWALVKITF